MPGEAAQQRSHDVCIDCSHTRYHVVRAAARQVGWHVNDADTSEEVPDSFYGVTLHGDDASAALAHPAQVVWVDKSVLSARVAAMPCYQRLNHFPSMSVVARKAVLFRRLMQLSRLSRKAPAAAVATAASSDGSSKAEGEASPLSHFFRHTIPPSFSSISDTSRLDDYQRLLLSSQPRGTAAPFFIIKPNTGCEGRGIRLTTTPLEALTEAERTDKKRECIVQLYIDRPLLIDGKKFDLRLYVLLLAVTPAPQPVRLKEADATSAVPPAVDGVRLYVHEQGLVRICAEPYAAPTEANCTDTERHLTNYAVNKKSALFKPAHLKEGVGALAHDSDRSSINATTASSTPADGDSNKKSLAELAAYVESLHVPGGWRRVCRRIDECICLTVLSGAEVLRRELISAGGARGDRADGRGCFELLGFDVMLRAHSLEPVLMEVNHSPSLFCDTPFDFAVKSAVLRDTFRLLETHMPAWAAHEGNGKRYAACTRAGSRTASEMEAAEAALLSNAGADSFGFRSLLPHYSLRQSGVGRDEADWGPAERAAQECIVQMSKQLR